MPEGIWTKQGETTENWDPGTIPGWLTNPRGPSETESEGKTFSELLMITLQRLAQVAFLQLQIIPCAAAWVKLWPGLFGGGMFWAVAENCHIGCTNWNCECSWNVYGESPGGGSLESCDGLRCSWRNLNWRVLLCRKQCWRWKQSLEMSGLLSGSKRCS